MKLQQRVRIFEGPLFLGALTAIVAIAMSGSAHAQIAVKAGAPTDDAAAVLIQRGGVTVTIDPATGRITQATPEDVQALMQQVLKDFDRNTPVAMETQANGMQSIKLPDDYMEVAVLRLLPDGTPTVECVQGTASAFDLLGPEALLTPCTAPAVSTASLTQAKAAPAPAVRAKRSHRVTHSAVRRAAGR